MQMISALLSKYLHRKACKRFYDWCGAVKQALLI